MSKVGALKGLVVSGLRDLDLDGLRSLKKIKFLSVLDVFSGLDFSIFPELIDLQFHWSKNIFLPAVSSDVRNLIIHGYKPSSKDLTGLHPYQN